MFRYTNMIISILLVMTLAACQSDFNVPLPALENLVFENSNQPAAGQTRITWPDRELTFYPLSPISETDPQEFMMVDHMGDRAMEYILRNGRLEEARFSLPDGSLVRFDLVGLQKLGLEPIVYHCTAHSSALYEMSYLPKNLAHRITEFQAGFWDWKSQEIGVLHVGEGNFNVPYARILKTICCANGSL